MSIRAIRGATTVDADTPEQLGERLGELFDAMLTDNQIDPLDIVSCVITATGDIHSEFPAKALRDVRKLDDVPFIGALEIDAANGLPLALRLLLTVESDLPRTEIKHAYLHGAAALRPDLGLDR